jgi:hypothetical protein
MGKKTTPRPKKATLKTNRDAPKNLKLPRNTSHIDRVRKEDIPDYARIELPDPDKTPYPKWNWAHRRRYLLDLLKAQGHRSFISQSGEARRFGVTPAQIFRDLVNVEEYLKLEAGSEVTLMGELVHQSGIQRALHDGEYKVAVEIFARYFSWLAAAGKAEVRPKEFSITARNIGLEVSDEDAEAIVKEILEKGR